MGLTSIDPFLAYGPWAVLGGAILALAALALHVIREKIRADHNRSLVEMALRDSAPEQRREIFEGLAGIRPFHPSGAGDPEPDDDAPALLPAKLTRRRRGG